MEMIKDMATITGAVIGVVTAMVSLYAKFMDVKKKNVSPDAVPESLSDHPMQPYGMPHQPALAQLAAAGHEASRSPMAGGLQEADHNLPSLQPVLWAPRAGLRELERAKQMVKAPAIALIVTGLLGLAFNMLTTGYAYVNAFVTPLDNVRTPERTIISLHDLQSKTNEEKRTDVVVVIMLFSFATASLMAVWAGLNMLKLKSYSLALAGSFAVMPGACFVCLGGLPVGIWSLVVLLREDVRSTFS